jgi:hypothetical protein
MSESNNQSFCCNKRAREENWIKAYWRPAMGWLYGLICFFDFIIFPLITMFLPIIQKFFNIDFPYTAWIPLTLTNGGFFHMAFLGIVGVTAWTRGQEKIADITFNGNKESQ